MNPTEYIRAIRRRWLDVALAVIVALVAGFFISSVAPPGPAPKTYEATSVLLESGNVFDPNAPSLEALAELTTVGEVPTKVANMTGYKGNPADLAAMVETSVLKEAGILKIKVSAGDAATSKRYADAFAKAIVSYLRDLQATSATKEAISFKARLDKMQAQIAAKDEALKSATPTEATLITSERDALVRQYGLLYESYRQIAGSAAVPVNLDLIQSAVPREVSSGGIEPPRSRTGILILAGILGLLAGIILVLVLDRFDSRIRTRQLAEKLFGAPVIAEIPYVSSFKRHRDRIVSLEDPRSSTADAFRIAAAILTMPTHMRGKRAANGNGNGNGESHRDDDADLTVSNALLTIGDLGDRPRRILVTSPGPSDGKTTITSNLAAVFGARGEHVTVMSCDLRRPYIHRLFGVPGAPGLSEALSGAGVGVAELPFVESPVAPNVRVVPSGVPPEQPGEILGSDDMRLALAVAQRRSDMVFVDTAPVLATSDAAPLVGEVDGVIVVARAGRTTVEVAERTAEVLRRLNAPVIGVILNAAAEMTVPRRYYTYRYYRRPEPPKPAKTRKGIPALPRHAKRG